MKKLLMIICLFCTYHVLAVDTSGCSPLRENKQAKETVFGATLKITSLKSPFDDCWNLDQSGIKIEYSWVQESPEPKYTQVEFWTNINSVEHTVAAERVYLGCKKINSLTYPHNTTGEQYFMCSASAYVPVGNIDKWKIEIAPQVDGVYDTTGFEDNYIFQI